MDSDIIVFSGQGSSLTFVKTRTLSSSAIASQFVEACHEIMLTDFQRLSPTERLDVDKIFRLFPSPSNLIDPPVQNHPLVQGILLYIHQILDFISYAEESKNYKTSISETAGFCSGILPAVIVSLSSCPNSTDFVKIATTGFRIALWISLRVGILCDRLTDGDITDHPWSMTICGLSVPEVETVLTDFNQVVSLFKPLFQQYDT
jgi:hypothetical protein